MVSYGYGGWPRYVPVAQRRRKAEREMEKLAKKGAPVQPVVIEGRKIAKTFWGVAWCENLEGYSDFANRLPRGRTYVRNGSVCHLEIAEGVVRAKVCGSELYTVTIGIKPLSASVWDDIKKRCAGKISSLLDLLGGKLADGVMKIVTDRNSGLFPKPGEIVMDCSCPDWATMCKHVAAVLYGVGARLDERPELLFLLRGVNHLDLISATVEDAVSAVVRGGSRRRIADGDLSEVFGVEVDEGSAMPATKRTERASAASKPEPAGLKPADKKPAGKKPDDKKPVSAATGTGRLSKAAPGKVSRSVSASPTSTRKPTSTSTSMPTPTLAPTPASIPAVAASASASTPSPAFPDIVTGAHVRALRMRLALTAKDFAKLVGVSGGAISIWERNDKALNLQDRSRDALKKVWNANMNANMNANLKPKRGQGERT